MCDTCTVDSVSFIFTDPGEVDSSPFILIFSDFVQGVVRGFVLCTHISPGTKVAV